MFVFPRRRIFLKNAVSVFLHGAYDQLTKRDDVRKMMDKYLAGAEVNYGLFQRRRAVSDDDERVFFRALIFDLSSENYNAEYIALQTAFAKAKAAQDTILSNYELVPIQPTLTLTSLVIVQAAKSQNLWCNDSMITILRGVSDLDAPLILRRDTKGEGPTLRTFLQDQYTPSTTAGNLDFLFKQVESATYQRVYSVHKKFTQEQSQLSSVPLIPNRKTLSPLKAYR